MKRLASLAAALCAAASPAAAGDDNDAFDLGSLGLDPTTEAFDDKLNLYGFADFSWAIQSEIPALVQGSREFSLGNVNLYASKNLTPRWRMLAEVRFLLAPNGGRDFATGAYTVTTTPDPGSFDRDVEWGGISIERAYVEYDAHPRLTVRAGRWLTPIGIWNIDHGSPAIIPTVRPYIIGEQLFPEHQTGLELFGSARLGEYKLSYHATVSNGRSAVEAARDPDSRPGIGGRLALEAPVAGTLRLGASAYGGRATIVRDGARAALPAYDELSLGADAQWNWGGLHVQGELISRRREFIDGRREASGAGFTPDSLAWGAYALAGYRFERLWNVMPFTVLERYYLGDNPFFHRLQSYVAGLNLRPTPAVVLKASFARATFDAYSLSQPVSLDAVRLQAAWVF